MDYIKALIRAGERMERKPEAIFTVAEKYLRVRDRRGR